MLRLTRVARVQPSRALSTFTSESILKRALTLVPQHGWEAALVEACRDLRLSDQATSMFAADDLVRFYYKHQLAKLSAHAPKSEGVFPRARELLLHRLGLNREIGAANVASGIAIVLKTHPASFTFEALSDISDEIWYKAGDRSTDTTWYSRRGALAGIYGMCEAFQSRDNSRSFKDTNKLAMKLIDGLEKGEYAESSIGEWLDFNARGLVNVLRTWR